MESPLNWLLYLSLATAPALGLAANVTDGLVYEWGLDEPTGAAGADAVSGKTFTGYGAPQAGEPGIFGSAFRLDGVDDYLGTAPAEETFAQSDFTLSAWVRTGSAQQKVAPLIDSQSAAGFFELCLLHDGKSYFFVRNNATNASVILFGDVPVNDDRWHLISMVREGSQWSLYEDARLASSKVSDAIGSLSGMESILIGGSDSGSLYKGLLDDVAIYDRALSPGEIAMNAVPEPGVGALLTAGLMVGGWRRRRNPSRRTTD